MEILKMKVIARKLRCGFLFQLVIVIAAILGAAKSQECNFTINPDQANFLEDIYFSDVTTRFIQFGVPEKSPVDSLLYSLTAVDNVISVELQQEASTALEFVSSELTNDNKTISAYVNKSMEGSADYDNPLVDELEDLSLEFQIGFEEYNCTLLISHLTVDENTKAPHFDTEFYTVVVREDYPVNYVLPNIEIWAYDYDGGLPNNEFEINTDDLCPIETPMRSPNYTSVEGQCVKLDFVLRHALNFDGGQRQYECDMSITDHGTPPLSSSSSLTLLVSGYPDEGPIFNSDFYYGYLESIQENSVVNTTPEITASDADLGGNGVVTFSMADADPNVDGTSFFQINPGTGEITLSQTLTPSFLVNEHVEFILYASDRANHTSMAFFLCELPYLPDVNETFLYFEQSIYSSQVVNPAKDDVVIKTSVVTNSGSPIIYSLENHPQYFDINSNGEIFCSQSYTPPDEYSFQVVAEIDSSVQTQSPVNVYVDDVNSYEFPYIVESVTNFTILENFTGLLTTVVAEGDCKFCLVKVDPLEFDTNFDLREDNGELYVVESLEDSEVREVTLLLGCYEDECPTIKMQSSIQLERNEALYLIEVEDINDNAPSFVTSQDVVVAYPFEETLQRIQGSVYQLEATDADSSDELLYNIEDPSNTFAVDSRSGDIFLIGEMECDSADGCEISATVEDSSQRHDSITITILGLPIDFVSTLSLDDVEPAEIEYLLSNISSDIGVELHLIYAIVEEEDEKRLFTFNAIAHVYAIQQDTLVSTSELNVLLTANGYEAASNFTEIDLFTEDSVTGSPSKKGDGDPDRERALEIAVVVLGSLLGLVLLAALLSCLYKLWENKRNPKKNISLIQNEYQDVIQGKPTSEPDTFSSIFGTDLRVESSEVHSKGSTSSSSSSSPSIQVYAITPENPELKNRPLRSDSYVMTDGLEAHASLPVSDPPELSKEVDDQVIVEHEPVLDTIQSEDEQVKKPEDDLKDDLDAIYSSSSIEIIDEISIEEEVSEEVAPVSSYDEASVDSSTTSLGSFNLEDIDPPETSERKESLQDTSGRGEGKTVAFKILVDTKEFEEEVPQEEENLAPFTYL